MHRTLVRASVSVVVLLLLAGCASPGTAQGSGEAGTGDWEQFHSEYPDVPMPSTEVVRVVSLDEWASVMADCLHDAGFPDVTADDDGGISYSSPADQASQLALAKYVCSAQYPIDPKYTDEPTDDMVGELYEYLTKVQVPCLEEQGITVPEPPSKTIYIESYGEGDTWVPYLAIPAEAYGDGTFDELQELCPQGPPPGSEFDPFS
jgi:hypothetical protein